MNQHLNNIEKIIKYLDGDLTPVEVEEFEFQLYTDESLQKDFIIVKEIEDSLRDLVGCGNSDISLKSVRMAFEESDNLQYGIEKTKLLFPTPNRWYHQLYKVASIIVIVFTTAFILNQILTNRSVNTEKLFAKYYQPFQKEFIRSSGPECDNTLLFYKAVSNLEYGRYNVALNNFNQLMSQDKNSYYIESSWYVALIWLKLNRPAYAKPYLNWLVYNDRYYGKKASLVLMELGGK